MADYQKVEINDATPTESVTLEQEAAAIDAKAEESTQQETPVENNTEVSQERPEWLPEKFQTAEDMAKAYTELETKQSSEAEADTSTEEPTEEPSEQLNVVNTATDEWEAKGELSENTYANLEKVGLSKDMVDQYIAGQQAIMEQQAESIYSEIGGKSEYESMSEWAGENLNDSDLKAYNETVESGTVDQAKFAVKALYSQYKGTTPPKVMQGSTNGSAVAPFTSRAQVTEAMRSKQYGIDPAYRAQVEQRLSISNLP